MLITVGVFTCIFEQRFIHSCQIPRPRIPKTTQQQNNTDFFTDFKSWNGNHEKNVKAFESDSRT